MQAVAQQPTIVGLDAEDDLLLYAGGIMQPTVCKNTTKVEELNHVSHTSLFYVLTVIITWPASSLANC